ncbi:docking protein 2 isoform X2 [Pangasianodon hypophthalmus]|uniref:docking protein 2 isoform X2 n=1 Tax=Pangasianodon hypophthalmus TaxID=310915 RepID=UPI0023082C3A|nr:docking protein 2 isoform X2 [Pangasianodon hypophthalmus]
MDILVKEGSLFLQGVKFGKIWRKIWVTVFKPSQAGIGRIEMYDMREGAGMSAKLAMLKKAEKRVIRLAECLSVTPALGESCPAGCTAFYLNTAQRIYTLAAPTQDDWVSALCSLAFQWNEGGGEARRAQGDGGGDDAPMTENDIYSTLSPGQFQVTVASSEASIRCCMFGSYLLSPEKESLCLLNMKTGHAAFCWPYRFLRRFGLVKEGITIEAGRRCQTGEGLFIFLSKQGPQIYRAIEEAIMHQSVQDLLSKATALPQENTLPPPPPPPPQTASPASPKSGISRRNLALPALPGTKPPIRSPQPESTEALYAKVKPLPKPRNVPTPPALPVPKLMPEPETKPKDLDISDQEPDYESCDWNQKTQTKEDSSDSQLYSTVRPLLHTRRKPDVDTNQEQLKSSRQSPEFGHAEVPVSFKQILSDVLFKDVTRIAPPPPPKTYRENSNLSAEPDYYEIQK